MTRSSSTAQLPALRGTRVLLRLPVPADVAARVEVPRGPEEHRMYDRSGEPKVFTQAEVEGRLAEVTGQDLAVARRFAIAALV